MTTILEGMTQLNRKYLLFSIPLIVLLAAGGWYYARRSGQKNPVASFVPATAIGYVEIGNGPRLLDELRATKAWGRLGPAYGVSDRLAAASWAGRLSALSKWTSGSEAAALANAQWALVVTAIEIDGDRLRPRLALIVETGQSSDSIHAALEKRVRELAENSLGAVRQREEKYAGVKLVSYHPVDDGGSHERGLYAARIEGEWILANHPDPLRQCLDARLGRIPAMAGNFYWRQARQKVGAEGELFGFVTGEGVTRLLRSGSLLLSGGAVAKALLAGAVGDVLTDFSSKVCEGLAFGSSVENGVVVDRYAVLAKPDLVESLQAVVQVADQSARYLAYVPPGVREWTVFQVRSPHRTLNGIEQAISARVGVGQSFLLHQFLLGAREAFLGIDSDETVDAALGDEIVGLAFTGELEDRIWLLAVKDQGAMKTLLENYLSRKGAAIRRSSYGGIDLLASSDAARSAGAWLGDFVAVGKEAELRRLIEARQEVGSLRDLAQFTGAARPATPGAITSYYRVSYEADRMMRDLAQLTGASPDLAAGRLTGQLPFAVRSTSLDREGILLETRSPLGNFPLLVAAIASVSNDD